MTLFCIMHIGTISRVCLWRLYRGEKTAVQIDEELWKDTVEACGTKSKGQPFQILIRNYNPEQLLKELGTVSLGLTPDELEIQRNEG